MYMYTARLLFWEYHCCRVTAVAPPSVTTQLLVSGGTALQLSWTSCAATLKHGAYVTRLQDENWATKGYTFSCITKLPLWHTWWYTMGSSSWVAHGLSTGDVVPSLPVFEVLRLRGYYKVTVRWVARIIMLLCIFSLWEIPWQFLLSQNVHTIGGVSDVHVRNDGIRKVMLTKVLAISSNSKEQRQLLFTM